MANNNIDITFFVPCLNEENNIISTIKTILEAVQAVELAYEILIIDDNSTDRTVETIENFQKSHPGININLIKKSRTMGLGRNYIDGSYIGRGKYYMLVNGDNAEPKKAIVRIIEKLGQADMIIPNFGKSDNRTFPRSLLSKIFTFLVNFTSGYSIKYYNGPVMHLRKNVMRWHPDTHGFAYQAEIITRILDEKATYLEVCIPNSNRQWGMSKAFRIKNILSVMHSLLQISLRRLRRILFSGDYV